MAQLGATASRVGKAARARVASVTFYQHTRRFWFLFVTETARFRAALKERGRGLGHAPFHDRELNLAADLLDDVHGLAGNLLDLGEVAIGEQGGLTIQVPPQAMMAEELRYSSTLAVLTPPVGIKRWPTNGAARALMVFRPPY